MVKELSYKHLEAFIETISEYYDINSEKLKEILEFIVKPSENAIKEMNKYGIILEKEEK